MEEKYSIEDVANIVDSEGLGYVIQSHISGEEIENEQLRTLWQECYKLMTEIYDILDPYIE